MCGICGLLNLGGTDGRARTAVAAATETLRHRGPDDGGVDTLGCCILGHRRLAVVDVASGAQPATNESGEIVCVMNGEIYNFVGLRRRLAESGHEIPGTGDTAVLPHLYEEYGTGFVEHLRGMFAIALWDARRQRLVLARDRIGKKPLLWCEHPNGGLAFASELKALLQLGANREVDLEALDAYLALQYIPAPRTALKGVHKLLPAHCLVADADGIRISRYWTLGSELLDARSDEEWLDLVRERVRAAVRRRLVSDVPIGALLSGGIDSAVVVAAMAEASPKPVHTFTVGFEDAQYDERDNARMIAQRYGTRHEEIVLRPDLEAALADLAWLVDEPLGDPAILPLHLICRAAREHVTVGLTGDGGDEAFAGYDRYRAYAAARALRLVPALTLRSAAATVSTLPGGRSDPLKGSYRVARFLRAAAEPKSSRYAKLVELFSRDLRGALAPGIPHHPTEAWLPAEARTADLAGLQRTDAASILPGALLPKADLASMAASLELRAPLLDHEVFELGIALPDSLKTGRSLGKLALRRAFASELPDEISSRRKSGFLVPLSDWFRQELGSHARDLLLDRRTRSRGLFDTASIERLFDEHQAGAAAHGQRLWSLVMLETWLRMYADGDALRAPPLTAKVGL